MLSWQVQTVTVSQDPRHVESEVIIVIIVSQPQSQLDLDFDFGLVWGWVWVYGDRTWDLGLTFL